MSGRFCMATFAQSILGETDFIKKIDIMNFLRKKQNIYFNTSVILKAEIAREFMDVMKLDVDRNLVVTACLLFDCLKYENASNEPYNKRPEDYIEYFRALGFSDRFCKICIEHTRKGLNPDVPREEESDILELVDQFGGLLLNRTDRLAYDVDEALEILTVKNMAGVNNRYLAIFQEFVDIMEDIKIAMLGLLSRVQKDLNCVAKNDISDAVRELYNINERNEKAFAQREKELHYGGDLLGELRKARAKLKLFEEAPLLPGFELEDIGEDKLD